MTVNVETACAGCGDVIEVELPEDGSDETDHLANSVCDACWDAMWEDPAP